MQPDRIGKKFNWVGGWVGWDFILPNKMRVGILVNIKLFVGSQGWRYQRMGFWFVKTLTAVRVGKLMFS